MTTPQDAAATPLPPLAESDSDPGPALLRAAVMMPPPAAVPAGAEPVSAQAVSALAEMLYARWYAGLEEAPAARSHLPVPSDPPLRETTLLSAFRAAHARAGELDPGWVVVAATPHGVLTAMRDGAVRLLQPGDYVSPGRPGVPPAPGEVVLAVARVDRLDAERQLWWTFSGTLPVQPLGRLYLNVRPATAARALRQVTGALAQADVNYQLKCPVLAYACRRTDALVIYHDRRCRDDAVRALLGRWDRLGPLLDGATPPLTRRAAPGLAWADDDAQPDYSFGELRCRALATAVLRAGRAWVEAGTEARVATLVEGLLAAGIDAERPWEAAT